MIFGFDLNGTITEEPEAFQEIMAGLVQRGHEVHIVTGAMPSLPNFVDRDYETFMVRLKDQGFLPGVHFTHFEIIVVDGVSAQAKARGEYCRATGMVMMFEDRSDQAEEIRKHCRVVMMWPSYSKEVQWPI